MTGASKGWERPGSRVRELRLAKRGIPAVEDPHEGGMLPVSMLREAMMISTAGMEPFAPQEKGKVPVRRFASRLNS